MAALLSGTDTFDGSTTSEHDVQLMQRAEIGCAVLRQSDWVGDRFIIGGASQGVITL